MALGEGGGWEDGFGGRSRKPWGSNGEEGREGGGGANWWSLANPVACGAIY